MGFFGEGRGGEERATRDNAAAGRETRILESGVKNTNVKLISVLFSPPSVIIITDENSAAESYNGLEGAANMKRALMQPA